MELGKRFAVVLALSVSACGTATERVDESAEAIVSGTEDDADTAAVFVVAKVGNQTGYCSGVVVSPHVVLTAAHCSNLTGTYSIYLGADYNDAAAVKLADNYVDVVEYHPHPKYDSSLNTSDVGVLITKTPIPRTPVAINRQPMKASTVGQSIRLVGFGQTSSDKKSFGRRHVGTAAIAAYDEQTLTVKGTPNICFFDSGGPTFMTQNGADVVLGIHYLLDSTDCNSQGFDMRADVFTEFIDAQIAAAEPPIVDAGASEDALDGTVPSTSSATAPSTTGCAIGMSGRRTSSFTALFALALASALALLRRKPQLTASRMRSRRTSK